MHDRERGLPVYVQNIEMASRVKRQSHKTPGYKAFQEHYSTLVDGVQDPAELAGKLFSRKMITHGIRIKVENPMVDKLSRCRELLTAVTSAIESDPSSFCTFISVLEEEPTLQVIAESMRKSYKTHHDADCNDIHDGRPEGNSCFQYFKNLSERISLKEHRYLLATFFGGLLVALLVAVLGHQYHYVPQDLWKQSEIPFISRLLNAYTTSTHNCTELEKLSIRHASDDIAPNNLPYVRGHFVGRDSELQEISHMLIHSAHSGVAMINIYGAPAVGKSTLAIKVGHELARHGIVVRYVNVNEAHNLFVKTSETVSSEPPSSTHTTDTSSQSITVTSHSTGGVISIPWYSYTENKYVLTSPQKLLEWARGLTNVTLLVLDNCDDLLQRNENHENEFKEILRALFEASNYLRIVATSRTKMLLVGGYRGYPLKELDPSSAVHLLQLQSSLISSEEGKVIAELVGNNPLGLGIVAGLVNEKINPPSSIIEGLKHQPIETLSQAILPESQRILKVLQFSYNYLHGRVQKCSQYLSHFPGSFHEDAALHILDMCNISDPKYCIKTLTRRSLLEAYWRGQPRYQFHRLIREFLQYIQSEYSNDHIETEFSLHYQRYYSQAIVILSQLYMYRRNSYSSEIKSSLDCDTHNFLNILQKMEKLQLDTRSVLNIAYCISKGTSFEFFLEILDHNDWFVKLLKALMNLFDQRMFEFSREIGLKKTTLLYFNVIYIVKEWLIKPKTDGSVFCMPVCRKTFDGHHSRMEKLSTADSNTLDAYYYHPLLCYLDCFSPLSNISIILISLLLVAISCGTVFITSSRTVCKSLFTIFIINILFALLLSKEYMYMYVNVWVSTTFNFVVIQVAIVIILSRLVDQLYICTLYILMWPLVATAYCFVIMVSILFSFNFVHGYYCLIVMPLCLITSLCFLFVLLMLLYSYRIMT